VSVLPASTVARLTGLSLRQLRYLARQELGVPSVRGRAGQGVEALYDPSDLPALVAMQRLRAVCGQQVPTDRLRPLMGPLTTLRPAPDQRFVLDTSGEWENASGPSCDVLLGSSVALVLDLDAVRQEARASLVSVGISWPP
jgi:hypothetical protein